MKMRVWLLVLIILAILLVGCTKEQSPQQQDPRIQTLSDENAQLKDKLQELNSQVSELKKQLDYVTGEKNKYLKELDEFYLTRITGTVDLMYWDNGDMFRALKDYNEELKTATWQTYNYRRDMKDFYWQSGQGGFFDDPFFEFRRKDQDQELSAFHLRIERLALGNNRSLAQEEYDKYAQRVLKETQIDKDLACFQQTTCRDIKVIKCIKENKNYHSWFEGSYLFTSYFDNRAALDAFEKFYCYSDITSIADLK